METEEDPRSFLATTAQLQEDLDLSTSDHDAAQADAHGYQYMPAAPQTVALYLGHLAADGKSLATINQARAATSHAHAAQGIPKADNPARHPGSWPKPSRAGGIRLQRPHRWTPSPPWPWPGSGRPPAFPDAVAGDAWSQQPWHRPAGQ